MKIKYNLIFTLIAVGLLVFLFFYLQSASSTVNYFFQEIRVVIYSRLSFISNFISEIKSIKALTEENIRLKEERRGLIADLAGQETLTEENIFLRESLRLPIIQDKKSMIVGIFNLGSTPRGHNLLINKGRRDGINKDDIVISSSGVLMGIVDDISEGYSRVTMVTHLDFKTTIKIISKNTSGIAVGSMGDGVRLDFISENDDVVEGDVVVTTGNDTFPPGLIVGRVVEVHSSGDGLFKSVRVKPAVEEINLSQALVLLR